MSELRDRLLLWHKLVCMVTGGIASTYVKKGLNPETGRQWVTWLRDVADEVEAVLNGRPFVLDNKGRRLVQSGAITTDAARWSTTQETNHEVTQPAVQPSGSNATGRKVSGVRVATRKKTI